VTAKSKLKGPFVEDPNRVNCCSSFGYHDDIDLLMIYSVTGRLFLLFAMIPNDTPPEVQDIHIAILRLKTPSQRVAMAARLSSDVIRASKRAIARVHPTFSLDEINDAFIELHHGQPLADEVRNYRMSRKGISEHG